MRDVEQVAKALWCNSPVMGMVDALKVDQRTVRRWFSGTHAVPPGVWMELMTLAFARSIEVRTACDIAMDHMAFGKPKERSEREYPEGREGLGRWPEGID